MLVNSDGTDHLLDDEPNLRAKGPDKGLRVDRLTDVIVTAGKNELRGISTGILYDTIVDQTGKKLRVRFPRLIVSGLGRHVFSSPLEMKRGVTAVLEGGNPHLRKGEVMVPFQQRKEELGMISFEVENTVDSGASSSGIAKVLKPGTIE